MTNTTTSLPVDPKALRVSVREKYREVARHPDGHFHFHSGRPLAALLGYDRSLVDALPDRAVESFAGVANPFGFHPLGQDDRLVDIGSGSGFDAFVAARLVGPGGSVVGVDMTPEMLAKARETSALLGLDNVEFREGIAEDLPIEDGWADVVVSNGVLNLVAEKHAVFTEIFRVLHPGGRLQFADIAVGRQVPPEATCNIDLWTDCIAGGLSRQEWQSMIEDAGFIDVKVGPGVDVFAGAAGERNARRYDVLAHVFYARKPQ
ncbi:methyltransferase domain-containing protein [Glycomyces sp. L485]|uniref:methyltransferase domain-containing protein n=1 Tax=Glycomyces sp. L485 TaxID=2909235 RepID=UPI001F4AE109|nr:methyltransferase domain-containing protein [Glycomyces sp. L485]MCH7231651.1 methyltransferase domain-containing protein [Glycomyces sp. L485]